MIFPILHFDDHSRACPNQTCAQTATVEDVMQGSGVGGAPVGYATAIHILGTKEDFYNLDETISKGEMPPKGLLMHLVRPSENGFEILDVWDQTHHAEAFFKERLDPLLQERGLAFTRTGESEIWDMART